MNEDKDRTPVDASSFSRLVEAKTAGGKLDMLGVKRIIERMKNSSIEDKRQLLSGAIDSVDLLLQNPDLKPEERGQIEEVKNTLQAELTSITAKGEVPPEVNEPGAQ